jgi:MSHA biogenesis protein MshQ
MKKAFSAALGLLAVLSAGPVLAQIAFRASSSATIQSLAPMVNFQAAGTGVGGAGAIAPTWPAHQTNDVALMFCESANQNITLTTANGFAAVTGTGMPPGTGAAAGATATRLHVFWARATSSAMAAPTVADPGDHVYCQILTYRGVITSGNPWDATLGGTKPATSTTVTVTGVTTTQPDTRIVQAVAHNIDNAGAQFGAPTGTNVTFTERVDAGTTQGNGGGIAVWDGPWASAGATGDTTATVGNSVNAFVTIALQPSPQAAYVNGVGTAVGANAAIAPAWPPHTTNDIGLLLCESANENITLTTANGFAAVPGATQGTGTAAGATSTRLQVWWARATSAAMAAPTVADPGNHVYCRIVTVRGAIASGNPWEVVAGGTKGTASTSVSMAAVTTTIQNTLIVHAVAHNIDNAGAQFSNVANANLSGLSEDADAGSTAGNGGGIAVWDGVLSTPGNTGSTTATVGSSVNAFVTIAFVPGTPRIAVPTGTQIGDLMVASIVVRPSTTVILPPSGWTAETPTVQAATTSSRQRIFWRVADATDAGGGVTYQWALDSSSTGAAGAIVSYSGVDTLSATPIDVIGGNVTASGTAHAATAVSTTVPNTMVISTHAFASSETWTPPAGMTERIDVSTETPSTTAGISLEISEVIQAAAGTTGNKTATALGNADAGTAQILALRPAHTHYSVSYTTSNVATCEPALVRIEAHHAGHGLAAPPAGTVMNIVTSTASGVWLNPAVTGTGGWTPSGANNGVATYTWPGNEAILEVRLRHNTPAALHLNITETPAGKTEGAGEDLTLTFANSVLRITDSSATGAVNVGTQIAAKRSDTGAGAQTLFVQAVATSPATGACTTLFRNQTLNVELAAQCNNPTACNTALGSEFQVRNSGGTFTTVAKNNGPAAPGSYTAVSLAFSDDTNAMAPFVVQHGDAGQTTLHMRYTLPAPPAATTITGTSNAFVTRPFGLAFRGANTSTVVAHGTDQNSTVVAAAGDTFTMTIAGYRWVQAEDDGTGNPLAAANITDNGITPSFTSAVVVAPSVNLPGVALGSMQRGVGCNNAATVTAAEFLSAGVPVGFATVTDWCYTEAGNVLLTATASNYITAGITVTGNSGLDDTTGTNGHVGRFRPKHFAVSAAAVTNRAALACASTFTYMSERLDLGFTLTAQNTQGGTTRNYHSAYAKLGLTTAANFNLGARSGSTTFANPSNRVSATASTGTWGNGTPGQEGTAIVSVQSGILRAASPDGPYAALNFGVAPTDGEVSMNNLDLDTNTTAGADTKNIGVSTEVRFGRLRVQNALASSGSVILPMAIALQYWDGAASIFRINSSDLCTTIAPASVTLTPTLSGGSTSVLSVPISNGEGFIRLAAPGAGNTGFVLAVPDLAAGSPNKLYLQGNWTGGAWDQNPSARGAWGLFGGQPQNFIYQRENY